MRAWIERLEGNRIAEATGQQGFGTDDLQPPPVVHPELIDAHELYARVAECSHESFSGMGPPNWCDIDAKLRLFDIDYDMETLELMEMLWSRIRSVARREAEARQQQQQQNRTMKVQGG